ncbi:hypothetical protein [Bowmanella denitrificans]|uniref:hypothetical protein n=1 Tax=Bowmanella denitrificans TaxID=366582 RepID=UPI000C9C2E58|nr:hypothetical protein [Bowmanella denitrificans]
MSTANNTTTGNRTTSQTSWEWIQTQPSFHATDLVHALNITLHQAQMAIDYLKSLGAVETVNATFNPVLYSRVKGVKPILPGKNRTSPKPKSARQRIWQAMRFLRKFTVDDLTGSAEATRASVEKYLSDLICYGYVVISQPQRRRASMAVRTGSKVVYMLLENTGYKYPIIRPNGLWDQNRKQLVELKIGKENHRAMA